MVSALALLNISYTGWGGHLFRRYRNMFSESSPCLLGHHGSCSSAQQPGNSQKTVYKTFGTSGRPTWYKFLSTSIQDVPSGLGCLAIRPKYSCRIWQAMELPKSRSTQPSHNSDQMKHHVVKIHRVGTSKCSQYVG